MLHEFLDQNRTELIERCRAKVVRRSSPRATPQETEHGIPLFLGQLIETLRGEHDRGALSPAESGAEVRNEIASTATKHGRELFDRGFSVDQVVYDYGDLCQAITELALECKAPVGIDEFKTLNRCLDSAIADAVIEFAHGQDKRIADAGDRDTGERLGSLAHELRNFLNTAMLSFAAIKSGTVALDGPTAGVLDRSLAGLRDLIDRALADVRLAAGAPMLLLETVAVDRLIREVQVTASLEARSRGCGFTVSPVAHGLKIHAEKQMLNSALSNLLQNAFKFTRSNSHVTLKAYGTADRVLIQVEDQCGGLSPGSAETMFQPFEQHGPDRSGLGLGLSIARRAVEASGGRLSVRDMPGLGCVFTIDLPRSPAS